MTNQFKKPTASTPAPTQKFLVYRHNVIVAELNAQPVLPANSQYSVLPDTPENRAIIAAWTAPLTQRQLANAEFMKLPDATRGAFAVAWVAINARLDANDTPAALAYFDTLTIPAGLEQQAQTIRAAIAAA